MCGIFGDPGEASRNQAAQDRARMRREEAQRRGDIRTGQRNIDRNFRQFDDSYYGGVRDDYLGAQTPQIQRQYDTAGGKLSAALADRGVLNSSIAGNAFGNLERTRTEATSDATNQAFDVENAFRDRVEKSKSNLYSLNQAAADPKMIAAQALGQTTALTPPQSTSQLGDIFASVLAPFANFARADMYNPAGGRVQNFFAPSSGGGSSAVYK
jgi:hypothetical protein